MEQIKVLCSVSCHIAKGELQMHNGVMGEAIALITSVCTINCHNY